MTRPRYKTGELTRYEADDRFVAEVDGQEVPVEVERRAPAVKFAVKMRPRGEVVNVAHSGVVRDEVVPAESRPWNASIEVRRDPGREVPPPEIASGKDLDLLAANYGLKRWHRGPRARGRETDEELRERLNAHVRGADLPAGAECYGADAEVVEATLAGDDDRLMRLLGGRK